MHENCDRFKWSTHWPLSLSIIWIPYQHTSIGRSFAFNKHKLILWKCLKLFKHTLQTESARNVWVRYWVISRDRRWYQFKYFKCVCVSKCRATCKSQINARRKIFVLNALKNNQAWRWWWRQGGQEREREREKNMSVPECVNNWGKMKFYLIWNVSISHSTVELEFDSLGMPKLWKSN